MKQALHFSCSSSLSFSASLRRKHIFTSSSSSLQMCCFRYLSLSLPFFSSNSIRRCRSPTRCCSQNPISARPSSDFRKSRDNSNIPPDDKLLALRALFSRPGIGIDAYIIPSEDAHQSEFIAECYMRRAYISGFTGSAGTAVVTKDKAALWTDGRYFLQAEKELNSNWILMRAGNYGVPSTSEWLNDVLHPGSRVGIDPFLFSYNAAEELKEAISNNNHELVCLNDINLVDEVWKAARPQPPQKPVRVHDVKYAGVDVPSKLSSLRSQLIETGSTAIVITMLDEIAWLLNVRGNDVPNSPVTYAYIIVEIEGAKLFIDKSKVTPEVMAHLEESGVELLPYENILSEIESLAGQGAKLWLDTSSANAAVVNTFKNACSKYNGRSGDERNNKAHDDTFNNNQAYQAFDSHIKGPAMMCRVSPITIAKAVKNDAEIEGMRNCHLRDAAALAKFWAWLEVEIHNNVTLTEVDVAEKLLEFRAKQEGFMGTSFDTISGYGANGAVIHYRPEPESCSLVGDKKLFLLDSGAQYVDGTTDITRTVHLGQPTLREKECFTRVLQGHIALDQAVFPESTPGFVLDVLARSSLWKIGLDYRHGTGHGVGAALNVHEGPQSISFRYGNLTALQKGMIISNEPGYYEDHSFGIRIENLLCVTEANTPNCYGGIEYLGFEKLTYVPIQTKLVDLSLLSSSEINWINDYHSQVWEKVSPLLSGSALEWLWNNTRPLPIH